MTRKTRTIAKANLPADEVMLAGLQTMIRIRKFEEMALYQSTLGNVHGTLHLYIGQEAIASGIGVNLSDGDYVASNHRGHGHSIAKGAPVDRMMAELFGRADGSCKGKGGSMHIADFSRGMLGANGIVAAGLGLAAGAALHAKQSGSSQVAIAFFGDGAVGRGPFHEVMNLAAIWKLPCIFICENNGYAQWVANSDMLAAEKVSDLADGYRIPGETVDGNDFLAVHDAAFRAIERARNGEGPSLLECATYRIHGHSSSDMNVYRTKKEIESWQTDDKDPIARLGRTMTDAGVIDAKGIKALASEIDEEIANAVSFAEASPYPKPSQLMEDVTDLPPVARPESDWKREEA